MHTLVATNAAPAADEGLAAYVRRLREARKFTQAETAERAGVHLQTVRKVERGITATLRPKARGGLARALGVAEEYLLAAERGEVPPTAERIKLCPGCWTPGHEPDPIWLDRRSHFCFCCGKVLLSGCTNCNETIGSWKFRFCPHCGMPYKECATEFAAFRD